MPPFVKSSHILLFTKSHVTSRMDGARSCSVMHNVHETNWDILQVLSRHGKVWNIHAFYIGLHAIIPRMIQPHSMHSTGVFHACIMRGICIFHACTMERISPRAKISSVNWQKSSCCTGQTYHQQPLVKVLFNLHPDQIQLCFCSPGCTGNFDFRSTVWLKT